MSYIAPRSKRSRACGCAQTDSQLTRYNVMDQLMDRELVKSERICSLEEGPTDALQEPSIRTSMITCFRPLMAFETVYPFYGKRRQSGNARRLGGMSLQRRSAGGLTSRLHRSKEHPTPARRALTRTDTTGGKEAYGSSNTSGFPGPKTNETPTALTDGASESSSESNASFCSMIDEDDNSTKAKLPIQEIAGLKSSEYHGSRGTRVVPSVSPESSAPVVSGSSIESPQAGHYSFSHQAVTASSAQVSNVYSYSADRHQPSTVPRERDKHNTEAVFGASEW